ncbi:MAG: copper resistance protein CopC, partial [Candidatus Limnocylindria bacterium]
MSSPRPWRLAGAIAVLALLLAPALPGGAGGRVLAHAQLVTSSPGAGVVVPEPPAEIRLVFSEPLESQATSVDIVAPDGTELLSRGGRVDPDDPFTLVVADPGLTDGIYSVIWRTLSAADGHTAEGFFSFGVGDVDPALAGAGASGMTHDQTDPIRVAGRWLTYVGLLMALGIAVLHRVVIRHGPMPAALVRVLAIGLFVSAGATLVAAVGAGIEAGSVTDYLFGSRNGTLQLARAMVAAVGGVAMLAVAPRIAGAIAAATGLVGIVLLVSAGHASALPGPVPVLAQVVHVAASAIWIGGLAGLLAMIVRPEFITGHGHRPAMRTLVPRFSAVALTSIGLIGLSGIYAAWMQTGTLVTTETEFGRTLLIKTAFAVGAIGLGGLNYLDGGRMLGWLNGMRARLTVEVGLAATVLIATAALSITPPTEEPTG